MTISATLLDSRQVPTGGTSIASNSHTVHNGVPVIVFVMGSEATPSTQPTLSGHALSWSAITTRVETNAGAARRSLTGFVAYPAADDTGTVTADFGANSQGDLGIIVVEFSAADNSALVVQSPTNVGSSNSGSVTLSAFADANNAVVAAWVVNSKLWSMTEEATWSELVELRSGSGVSGFEVEFKNSEDTSATLSLSGSANWAGLAIELAQAAGGSDTPQSVAAATTVAVGVTTVKTVLKTVAATSTLSPALTPTKTKQQAIPVTSTVSATVAESLDSAPNTASIVTVLPSLRQRSYAADPTATPVWTITLEAV